MGKWLGRIRNRSRNKNHICGIGYERRAAILNLGLGRARLPERHLRGHGDERVQLGIERFDARQAGLRQLDGRELLRVNKLGNLVQAQRQEFGLLRLDWHVHASLHINPHPIRSLDI